MHHANKSGAPPTATFEFQLSSAGMGPVCGLDEAGRGSWAGPVVAAAVILPASTSVLSELDGVNDSKRLTPLQREKWAAVIKTVSRTYGIGMASNQEIDRMGIVPATRTAMARAIRQLSFPPAYLLLDYILLPEFDAPQTSLPRGDSNVLSIAAASILAKTSRDHLMIELENTYPDYGFGQHKGYGTKLHRERLQRLGPCAIHRRSFSPVKSVCS